MRMSNMHMKYHYRHNRSGNQSRKPSMNNSFNHQVVFRISICCLYLLPGLFFYGCGNHKTSEIKIKSDKEVIQASLCKQSTQSNPNENVKKNLETKEYRRGTVIDNDFPHEYIQKVKSTIDSVYEVLTEEEKQEVDAIIARHAKDEPSFFTGLNRDFLVLLKVFEFVEKPGREELREQIKKELDLGLHISNEQQKVFRRMLEMEKD